MYYIKSICMMGLLIMPAIAAFEADQLPNIVFIYADDLGYGDLSSYNQNAAYTTPSLDKMASEGIRFTDGHSACTVCTPSRYSLLTGKQPYRGPGTGVTTGVGGPSKISDNELTVGQMLQSKGYRTGVFGKWHVGISWFDAAGQRITTGGIAGVQEIDYDQSTPLVDGPNRRGFDKSFITVACPTTDFMYAYVVDGMVPVKPTFRSDNQSFPNHDGRWRTDFRGGWTATDYTFEGIDWVFLSEASKFVIDHQTNHSDKPFFMMLSTQIAHAPVLPHPDLIGSTGAAGARGDFVYELDTISGEVFKLLDSLGIDSSTMVFFSADNGPENFHVAFMRDYYNHDPAFPWRGVKRDGWEGGHRVPFMVRWPGVIPSGIVSDQMINQTDLFATIASLVGFNLPDDQAHDSWDMLPVFLDLQPQGVQLRDYLLTQTWQNNFFQIRQEDWKYIDGQGSGGNNYDGNQWVIPYKIDDPTGAPAQLYDLATDPGEISNLYYSNSAKQQELENILDASKSSGRSAPLGRVPFDVPTGCMNPAFQEYDPSAIFSDSTLCNTLLPVQASNNSLSGINLTGSLLTISIPGPHAVTIWSMDGQIVDLRDGKGEIVYDFSDFSNKGLNILEVRNGSERTIHKLMIE